jgi:hypothetical protein
MRGGSHDSTTAHRGAERFGLPFSSRLIRSSRRQSSIRCQNRSVDPTVKVDYDIAYVRARVLKAVNGRDTRRPGRSLAPDADRPRL